MTFNKTLLTATLLAIGSFTAMSGANAKNTTDTFNVTMTVASSCTVAAGSEINLGSIDAGGVAPSIGTSTFNVACSKGTPYTISMLPSGSSTAGIGTLKGTSGNDDTITYQLTSDSAGNTIWTDGSQGKTGLGTETNQSFEVYAKVTTDDFKTVKPDIYSETVTVSVAY